MNLDVKEAFCQKRNININMFSITIFPTQKYVITHLNPLLLSFYTVINIRCSVETCRATEKQFFLKNKIRTENYEFSYYKFANFL